MKRFGIALWLTLVMSLHSCMKDLGNYNYTNINTFAISGLAENYIVKTNVDTLRVNPKLDMSIPDTDPQRYTYRWIIRLENALDAVFQDTIGYTPQLIYPVEIPERDYKLVFQIKDKKTDVVWEKSSVVQVKSATARGIMLIGEDENQQAEIDMVSMIADTTIVRNLLSRSGLPPLREPIGIQHSGGAVQQKLWVFTGDGSYFLNRSTFKGNINDNLAKITISNLSLTQEDLTPILMAPQLNNASGSSANSIGRVLLTKSGHIFGGNVFEIGGDYYLNPLNRESNNPQVLLPAAPYLFYPLISMSNMLWYDMVNNRFMNIPSFFSVSSSTALTDNPGDIFPWNQGNNGRKLIYGENTQNNDGGGTNGNSFAIMKDIEDNYFVYKFYAQGARPLKLGSYAIKSSIAINFGRATQYAFARYRTLLFYVADNKLYAYDYNPGNERLYQLNVTGNEEITMIKMDTQINPTSNSMYIATYNSSTKGTLQRFTLGTNPNTVELTPVANDKWDNLVKIKNMAWRAVN